MNIPQTCLDNSNKIMLIGIGGGFDVFTGLPFVYHWPDKEFFLVNSGVNDIFHYRESTKDDPEGFIPDRSNIKAKYTVGRHGHKVVKLAYEKIAEKHQIDCILAVDGGVDSLAVGDEENPGTILEDFISISAINEMKTKKVLCCAGFGTETEEEVNHYRILENIAKIVSDGNFLGSFSLTKNMPEFQEYVKTCELAWAEDRRKSHIQTKIISAVNGKFGRNNQYKSVDPRLSTSSGTCFISPLSSIFWMFDFAGVMAHNKIVEKIKRSNTFIDAKILLRELLNSREGTRKYEIIPL